jgi:hypothetical protein
MQRSGLWSRHIGKQGSACRRGTSGGGIGNVRVCRLLVASALQLATHITVMRPEPDEWPHCAPAPIVGDGPGRSSLNHDSCVCYLDATGPVDATGPAGQPGEVARSRALCSPHLRGKHQNNRPWPDLTAPKWRRPEVAAAISAASTVVLESSSLSTPRSTRRAVLVQEGD